ncbi:MAG TPA: iron-sulfur cluster repair di-iron protein [Daejeonella sp.]|nr:iron-sulfur cluster repair di-iron protein [Daejeonella sp.]
METNILDVTVIEPRLKHPTIFKAFDALADQNSLVIHNDHDPKPLYYQLLAERGQTFTWEYLENGPQWWKVKITKRAAEQNEETIGEIVAKDYRKAQVFKKLGIDFCCGGKKTLNEVSEKKGISADEIRKELAAIDKIEKSSSFDFDKWNLDFLSDFIVNTHHQYVRDSIPFISELSQKVARVHGSNHPEMIQVAEIFARVAQDLSLHLTKEERILFPHIKALAAVKRDGTPMPATPFGGVKNPVQVMEMEHEQAGEDMVIIRELTSDYTLPSDACTSYSILFKKLEEFEGDLHQHVHLENNILFPKAIELEKELA